MRCVVGAEEAQLFWARVGLLTWITYAAATGAQEATESQPLAPLTNLFQLRHAAEQQVRVTNPFRVVATVMDVDPAVGAIALRDESGQEFVLADFNNRDLEPGAKVCLEGSGCGFKMRGFGLAIVPGLVADNDAVHPVLFESGKTFLRSGLNPIEVQWFNRLGERGLAVEYEGPGVPRQRIPSSALTHARVDHATGRTNVFPGLKYRYYEGDWEFLPDFRKYRPVKTGVATNIDPVVRARDDMVGLEFNGFVSVPQDGVYTFHLASDDGSRLFVGKSSVEIRVLSKQAAPGVGAPPPLEALVECHRQWVTLEGTVESLGDWSTGGEFRLQAGDHGIRAEVFENGNTANHLPPVHSKVRVSGIYENILTDGGARVPGRLLVLSWNAVRIVPPLIDSTEMTERAESPEDDRGSAEFPILRSATEIKALSPELAKQEHPVMIRGVITASSSKHWGVVVQDSTGGVFVNLFNVPGADLLRRGEFCQIEGVTGPGWFAPVVEARRVTRLGAGQLPKPVRATWDQLMNGSLDTEYAEVDGFVTAIRDRNLVLLTLGGKITVEMKEFHPETLRCFEGALVRIRGCFLAVFNLVSRKLEPGSLVVSGAEVDVLQTAPADFFETPQKSIEELLLYDPNAAPFRLLKISGQVIYSRAGECFLSDGTNGVRVTTRTPDEFPIGELVDAVGFLQLGGPAAELREGLVRRTGRAPVPEPTRLASDQLLIARHAGTLVQVDATLVNHWREASEQVLELQSGFRAFRARIRDPEHKASLPPSGSRLELTAVYVPRGNRAPDGTVNAFELLLPSQASVRVLATPPWWTLKRVLVLAGILATLLLGALVWNKGLQVKVEERGRQLETEIRNRQQAELQRAAEAERSRIARDLHDDLGTGLTEVSLLASAGLGRFEDGPKIRDRFHAIAEKSRSLVSGLDFIVWAIDPSRNSLQSFADYLGGYTKELFSNSAIDCRLRSRIECGAFQLTEAERHSLFLAVKEALNNVIRHAMATEVEFRISQAGGRLHIVITDNGGGFDPNKILRGNGLSNLQDRLRSMRGECVIESQPGKGTTVRFIVPLNSETASSTNLKIRCETDDIT
jgi:signal transduction histidine kinase